MEPPVPSVEDGSERLSDPWDWNVDVVVANLCNPRSSLRRAHATLLFPEDAFLEAKIRENDVTGLALLREVGSQCLRSEFGIASMGQRATLNAVIDYLRLNSANYQMSEARRDSSVANRSFMISTPTVTARHSTFFQPAASPRVRGSLQSPTRITENLQNVSLSASFRGSVPSTPRLQNIAVGEALHADKNNLDVGFFADDDDQPAHSKWIKLSADLSRIWYPENKQELATSVVEGRDLTKQQALDTDGQELHGKQKKRIAPINISPLQTSHREADLNKEEQGITSQKGADQSFSSRSPEERRVPSALLTTSSDNDSSRASSRSPPSLKISHSVDYGQTLKLFEPGVVQKFADGRRRVMPTAVNADDVFPSFPVEFPETADGLRIHTPLGPPQFTDPVAPRSVTATSLGQKAQRRPDQMYLSHEAMIVDSLFYGDTYFGNTVTYDPADEDIEFQHTKISHSAGQQQFVYTCLKHYMSRPLLKVASRGQQAYGVVPYKEKLALGHRPLSMTMYTRSPDGSYTARRVHRADWLQDDSGTDPMLVERQDGFGDFKVAEPRMAVDEDDTDTWKALEKWRHVGGDDEVLPVYGDSGSEGEYDMQTWREMEQESGQLQRTQGLKRLPQIPGEQVQQIVLDTVASFIEQWNSKKKPTKGRKGWRLWMKAKRDKTRPSQIADVERRISSLALRLNNLCQEIFHEKWCKEKKLRTECQILQPTAFDLEENKWKKEILQLPQAPPRPPPIKKDPNPKTAKTSPEHPVADGEELLTSDTRSSSGYDSLDEFIVSDEEEQRSCTPPVDPDESSLPMDIDDETSIPEPEENGRERGAALSTRIADPFPDTDQDDAADPITVQPPLPSESMKYLSTPRPPTNDMVDLTQMSSDIEPISTVPKGRALENVSSSPSKESRRPFKVPPKIEFKNPPLLPQQQHVIEISSSPDSPGTASVTRRARLGRPDHSDVDAIRRMNVMDLLESQDRRRLLVWLIACTPVYLRESVFSALHQHSMLEIKGFVSNALSSLLNHGQRIRGLDQALSDGMMQLAHWFISYTIPNVYDAAIGIDRCDIQTTIGELPNFSSFYDWLVVCAKRYEKTVADSSTDSEPLIKKTPKRNSRASVQTTPESLVKSKKRQKIQRHDSEVDETRPRKKHQRVFAVNESQGTLDKRKQAQTRMLEDEARRRLEIESGALQHEPGKKRDEVVVNPGKLASNKFIYLDPRFGRGRLLMPHQIDGLRFLWREITADQDEPQGCLLAHTMGLGKTIQVLALLVVLACSGNSSDPATHCQVPPHLQKSHTLILCPPGLIDNWYDEILTWIPESLSPLLGEVRKVTANIKNTQDRIWAVKDWSELSQGILLMPYSIFKDLVSLPEERRKLKKKIPPQHEERRALPHPSSDPYASVRDILNQKPSLVIADEAHDFKNQFSILNKCIKRIETKSRVALTGSPLSNALAEYYSLIHWTSPGFLGTSVEFRATYEEPIKEGLYGDSSRSRYRYALKKLRALQLVLEPKVHRAEMSALDDLLHGKNEVLIQMPLTALQTDLYKLFVQHMLTSTGGGQMTLFAYLKVLQLLCHHPKLYFDWLEQKKQGIALFNCKTSRNTLSEFSEKSKSTESNNTSEVEVEVDHVFNRPEAQSSMSSLIQESLDLRKRVDDLDKYVLSPKYKVMIKIIELSLLAGDKVLIFSHRLAPLDYISKAISDVALAKTIRIDGKVATSDRQKVIKTFNEGDINVCLISTTAGGVGLNLFAANRVIILDAEFNPMHEQQAVGRAYRIGQKKRVFVYRLHLGGTFEDKILSQGKFKKELAERAVDKKEQKRSTDVRMADYLFEPKTVEQRSLEGFDGQDINVLDRLLSEPLK